MSDRRHLNLQMVGQWIDIIRGMPLFEPEPGIREWVEGHKLPVPANHNRMAAAAGQTWEFSKFAVLADWVFEFLKESEADVLFSDGSTRRVKNRVATVLKDSQSGLSTIAMHALAWWINFRGGNAILVTDCRQQARDFARDRLEPILDAYPELAATKDEKRTTALALRYNRGGTLYLGGGQSASEFISKPASLTIADEVAKHDLINEMPSLKLLEGRITADDEGKLLAFSTPDNALEYEEHPLSGKLLPVVTKETVVHASYLRGTQERVEVPCPHCGHYQELKMDQLRFGHCKEDVETSDKGTQSVWNKSRVDAETFYQCEASDECPPITEDMKPGMIARRRYVATNLSPDVGHRSLQGGAFLNMAFASRRWGAIANEFIKATESGGEGTMKAFYTDILGIPFSRYKIRRAAVAPVAKLKRGYRRLEWDGKPRLKIPLNAADIRFVGMTADVQRGQGNASGEIGSIEWMIWAAGWDGSVWVLDWGSVPELSDLPDVVEDRKFTDRDDPDNPWTVAVVCVDTGYRADLVHEFLAGEGGSTGAAGIRWVGIRGKDAIKDRMARVKARWVKEFPARDKYGAACTLRIIQIKADHWEHELHLERIAKAADGKSTRPTVNLPVDTSEEVLTEIGNMEHYHTKPDKGNIRELRWRKRNERLPNDKADLIKYALVVIDAVEADESTEL